VSLEQRLEHFRVKPDHPRGAFKQRLTSQSLTAGWNQQHDLSAVRSSGGHGGCVSLAASEQHDRRELAGEPH
jgi:hypothetical protein